MILLVPVLAAVTQTASLIFAKVGLTRRRISIRDYIPGLFLLLTICSALTLPKLGQLNLSAFTPSVFLQLATIVVIATIWNVLFYVGLSKEKVNTSEGIMILVPIATIVIAWIFKPAAMNMQTATVAIVATLVVAWAYRSKRLFHPDRYSLMLIGSVVLMGLENVLAAQILQLGVISPATLYTIRSFIIFIILYFYYRPSLSKLKLRTIVFLAFSAVIGATSMILKFYGLRDAGITLTALVLILVPVLVFSSAALFLHEKIKLHQMVGMTAVGALIMFATIINYANLAQH